MNSNNDKLGKQLFLKEIRKYLTTLLLTTLLRYVREIEERPLCMRNMDFFYIFQKYIKQVEAETFEEFSKSIIKCSVIIPMENLDVHNGYVNVVFDHAEFLDRWSWESFKKWCRITARNCAERDVEFVLEDTFKLAVMRHANSLV